MKITFEVDNLEDAAKIIAAMGGETAAPKQPDTSEVDAVAAEEAKKKEAAAKRKAAREKKKAEEEAAAKAKAEAKAAEDDDLDGLDDDDGLGDDEPTYTREDVRAKLKEVQSVKGKPAAIQILKDNGASSMSELAENKFADAIAAAEEALG